jgi:hypothetical protein
MKATTIRMIWGTAASMRICFSFQGILLSTTLVHGMSLDPPLAKPFTAAAIISKNNNNQANSCVEDTVPLSRRRAFQSLARVATGAGTASVISQSGFPGAALADDDSTTATTNAPTVYDFHNRDRKGNAQAVIRDDYWYILGKTPPQLLTTQLKGDDPQWNAFGSCSTSEATGTNSCTYVSLNQRIPAYSKYASSIAYGAREYQQLGGLLKSGTTANNDKDWWTAAEAYVKTEAGLPPPAAVDAELKMVLFATGKTTMMMITTCVSGVGATF